ncbi:MAG TPA: SWIM zinc finger family protein, partial [Pirellulales bacterium]
AQRRAKAARKVKSLEKTGRKTSPVVISGSRIAATYWGRAWCDHLESYSDYSNRLPRGRSYVRNGSVVDLQIKPGQVTALVSGSDIYTIEIEITPLAAADWKRIKASCAGRIGSLVELLHGKLADDVMQVVAHREQGLFPKSREIHMQCSCPDGAYLCKHLAAVLYGVGARLDTQPELLFVLRKVDHLELIDAAGEAAVVKPSRTGKKTIAAGELADVFGIELDQGATAADPAPARRNRTSRKPAATEQPLVTKQPAKAKPARKKKAAARPANRAKPTAAKGRTKKRAAQ